ncbi:hypothetical protein EW146_g6947 [Bondarzewia mesenterica]|uniref:Uncharacterized protein n=1 Tax=Bondarzewia mesenterica TaxID=1095465 RepID=A0A4S4LP33_9AGAM|nr:hypothetical protein EW146_g6947 [Bondarzewia mesenterica]
MGNEETTFDITNAKVLLQTDVIIRKSDHLIIVHSDDLRFLEDNRGQHERMGDPARRVRDLVSELDAVVIEPTTWDRGQPVEPSQGTLCEEVCKEPTDTQAQGISTSVIKTRRDGAQKNAHLTDDAADGVHREDIERIVIVEVELELPPLYPIISRCNGNETGDGARAEADDGPLALEAIIAEHPCKPTNAGSGIRDDARLHRTKVGTERRAAVETEPAEPEKDRAENDVARVVRLVRERLCTIPAPLAQVDVDRERDSTRRDMHGLPPARRPPRTKDHPFEFDVQQAIRLYTNVDQMKMKTSVGPSRARSAMAGMRMLPIDGFSKTPFRPKYPSGELSRCRG